MYWSILPALPNPIETIKTNLFLVITHLSLHQNARTLRNQDKADRFKTLEFVIFSSSQMI